MSSKRFILLVIVTVTLGFSGSSIANSVTTQVTNNSYEDSFPRIKGDYIVWQGRNDGDWEIFLHNIATGVTTQITDNDHDDLSPQTDGSYVVWQGVKEDEWDIFLWDGSEILTISDRGAEDTFPQILNGLIVWTSEPFGDDFVGPSEVILYDAGAQTHTVLSASVDPGNTLSDGGPMINDEVVIWVQTDNQDNTVTHMYNLANATITQNPDYVWRDNLHKDGNLSVLIRHDGHDREIFLYNSNSREYHQVTDNGLQDRYPSICGSRITWMAGKEIFLAEYRYLALISPKNKATLPKRPLPTFIWEGVGYERFNVEFSDDQGFLTGNALTSSIKGPASLSEMSFTPTEEEWDKLRRIASTNDQIFWRVEGAGVSEDLSETRRFTIEISGVAVTATTGDTDVGMTGGDGGPCFIGTMAY